MRSTKNGGAQEDATLLAFRRRRKKLIAFFSTFLVSLALTIAALLTFLILDGDSETVDRTTTVDPALRAFCSVVNSTPSCLASFEPIIYTKPVANPNQIFTLSLETAAEEIRILISLLSNTNQSNLSGCSSSLREALKQINETFLFVDRLQRYRMMNRILSAEEDLKVCAADDSGKEVEEKVERAKMVLGYSRDFLSRYDGIWLAPDEDRYSSDWHRLTRELEENVFVNVLCGLQLWFLSFLICYLRRIH